MNSSTALPGLDHEHHPARLLEQRGHFRERMRADDLGALGLVVEKIVHLGNGAVEGHHGEAVVVHVQNQILAHHGQPNQCNVSLWFHLSYQLKIGSHAALFCTMLCLQKMRSGMGRPHAGFLQMPCFAKKTLAWAKRRYNSPPRAPAVFYEKPTPNCVPKFHRQNPQPQLKRLKLGRFYLPSPAHLLPG